jgi:hypothetical protein
MEALAMYDATYGFQLYRLFQGEDRTNAERNAMNNIFALWTELFCHRLDRKPYQPSVFMLTLHSLFGELAGRGVKLSLAKDFQHYGGGFMRNLEAHWNSHKLQDDTFAGHPTKFKMPEDYAKDIQAAVIRASSTLKMMWKTANYCLPVPVAQCWATVAARFVMDCLFCLLIMKPSDFAFLAPCDVFCPP